MSTTATPCGGSGCPRQLDLPNTMVAWSRAVRAAGWKYRGSPEGRVLYCPDHVPATPPKHRKVLP